MEYSQRAEAHNCGEVKENLQKWIEPINQCISDWVNDVHKMCKFPIQQQYYDK